MNVLRVQHILYPMHFLNPSIVDCNPDRFLVSLEDSSFNFDSLALNVLLGLDVDFPDDRFPFLEGSLIEGDPNLAFRRY